MLSWNQNGDYFDLRAASFYQFSFSNTKIWAQNYFHRILYRADVEVFQSSKNWILSSLTSEC